MTLSIRDRKVTLAMSGRNYDVDAITARHSAFPHFAALVGSHPSYRPSIYLGGKSAKAQRELLFLSIRHNAWMRAQGDSRRVYQGDWSADPVALHDVPESKWAIHAAATY